MADVKKVPCPTCGLEFTEKGLPGHIAFKHGRDSASTPPKAPQPSASEAVKPDAGAPAGKPASKSTDDEWLNY